MLLMRPAVPPASFRDATSDEGWPVAVARAIATSPAWADLGPAKVAVRREPSPWLGIVGRFDTDALARLEHLEWQVRNVLPRLSYLSYGEVEGTVERLADALLARVGESVLDHARFTAMPRGGHIVLGMLAYALDLRHDRLDPQAPDDGELTVLVDDIALTGRRLRRYLDAHAGTGSVLFAPLFSHPEMRAAVEREPRIAACVSAGDLRDLAPHQEGAGYEAWRASWLERQGDRGYWVGRTEHVCFPWSEPDIAMWNPVEGREELAWRLVPPALCLKHRGADGSVEDDRARRQAVVEIQEPGPGPLRAGTDVVAASFEGDVLIASPTWNTCMALDGTAAEIWRALLRCGNVDAATNEVAETYDVDRKALRGDVLGLVQELRTRGALAS